MTYKDNYKLIDWSKPIEPERRHAAPFKRSDLPFPMVISDQMDPTEHPCDGKHYTSKSGFRRVTKANNCVEVGNDPQRFRTPKRPDRDKAIEQSIDKAIARASA